MSAEYWRKYRARNRERINAQQRAARSKGRVRNRSREYARRASRAVPPLAPIYPELRRGAKLAFREEELAMDVEQERALAEVEGRDPNEAARAYRARERAWIRLTTSFPEWL